MGQKINPKGFRIGGVFGWDSRWYASGIRYSTFVLEDEKIRRSLLEKLRRAGITKVEIERSINKINIILHVVRPGMVIGRGGQGMDEIKHYVTDLILSHRKKIGRAEKKTNLKMDLKVEPVKEPNLSAYFMASQIVDQLAKRLNHKRVVNFAMDKIMSSGAKGVKIILSGRIAGAEISRRETYKKGSMPLSTLREEIDFVAMPSLTKSGYIGVKVWICK
ncbi:30S ribosomal protein S3 [Candidatus Gottesmanbacteria bacterium RIFCSPHIGHO2_02_FULL_40_13]|uniref:Small ribosomal subunit protein uS3 n=1 Tax=Candidatus Gottesmanbacteria bacterium RIFCSPHIGHO2_02_FULL_40_13 TaxID=1798384 RepID=A0A1F6A734_9BACT|nr:MAG: 30S ribosomal protein S3 [Candidatus Gottesmanbacteria bacterium RIFCSPHIGHO2_02_FULL_40_13]